MNNKPIWHILGAGSMGLLWAAYLSKAGYRAVLIAKNAKHKKLLNQQTHIRLKTADAEHQFRFNIFDPSPDKKAEIKSGQPINNLMICLKSHTTKQALDNIKAYTNEHTRIILLQNGMGNEKYLAQYFPNNPYHIASTTEAAKRLDTTTVAHTGAGNTTFEYQSNNDLIKLKQLVDCDLHCCFTNNIAPILWQKLIINSIINPITALADCLNGDTLKQPQFSQHFIKKLVNEALLCSAKENIKIDSSEMTHTLEQVIMKTAKNSSSMREDIKHQRPTEIHYINGFLLKIANKHQIHLPSHQQLVNAIDALEKNYSYQQC